MLKIDKVHSMDEYLALLRTSSTIYVDNERLDRAVKDACYTADDYKALTTLELCIESAGSYNFVSPEMIVNFLEDVGVDFERHFRNRRTQGYSLDIAKVVNPLIERGVQVDLLKAYKVYRSYKTYASFLRTMVNNKGRFTKLSNGRIILEYTTNIKERENLRAYYRDIAVVSIPRIYSSIITTPNEGYHIAWCDYPQADWRFAYNLFIRDETNVDIMRESEDAYEGLAKIIEGDKFDHEVFKTSRKEYKVNCLSVFYNSRNKNPIPSAMREYFRSRERYRRYLYDLEILQKFRLPVPCTSYFGYEQLLPEASYPDAFVSKGMNTPIQTFTSHIVNETVFGILEKFWSLGYTKEDINVYFVRHDEPLFLFKDSIIKDAWVFEDCRDIFIPGFTPITLDFHFGNFYKEDDEFLTSEIARSISSNESKVTIYRDADFKEESQREYRPVPTVESCYVQFFREFAGGSDPVGLKVIYHDYRNDERRTYHSKQMTTEAALRDTLPEHLAYLSHPRYLLVYNDGLSIELDSVGEGEEATLIKVISRYDSRVVQCNGEE